VLSEAPVGIAQTKQPYDHGLKSVAAPTRQQDNDGFNGEDLQESGMGKLLCGE
jgi:hypothetical protein